MEEEGVGILPVNHSGSKGKMDLNWPNIADLKPAIFVNRLEGCGLSYSKSL
jgi:hypothetical protein